MYTFYLLSFLFNILGKDIAILSYFYDYSIMDVEIGQTYN